MTNEFNNKYKQILTNLINVCLYQTRNLDGLDKSITKYPLSIEHLNPKSIGYENKSPKKLIYNYINDLKHGNRINYKGFQNLLNDYTKYLSDDNSDFFKTFSAHNSFCVDKNQRFVSGCLKIDALSYEAFCYKSEVEFFSEYHYDKIKNAILSLAKLQNNGFISNTDKAVIESYAFKISGFDNGKEKIHDNPEEYLSKKLGTPFETYSKELKELNLQKEFSAIVKTVLEELDTKEYIDDEVECFLNAAKTENFLENVSECELLVYNNHLVVDAFASVSEGKVIDTSWFDYFYVAYNAIFPVA